MTEDFRDEQGRFTRKHPWAFTSENASEMGARHGKQTKAEHMQALAELAGYQDVENMPIHLKLFAQQFCSGSARSVSAGVQFVRQALGKSGLGAEYQVQPGETCPTCGTWMPVGISIHERLEGQQVGAELIAALKKQHQEKPHPINTDALPYQPVFVDDDGDGTKDGQVRKDG